MSVVRRSKRLLLHPTAEWAAIAAESEGVQTLFTRYAMILSAIPALAHFVGHSTLGVPIGATLSSTMIGYVLSLASVYALATVIDALAPHFQARKDFTQSLRVATFSWTGAWVAGVFNILPALAIVALAGSLYSLYLLAMGIAAVKQPPPGQIVPYTVVVVIAMLVLMVIAGAIPALAIPSALRGF